MPFLQTHPRIFGAAGEDVHGAGKRSRPLQGGIQGGKIYRIVRTSEWIDIDIPCIERSEILEEMGPLAGIDAESRQGAFNDDPCL